MKLSKTSQCFVKFSKVLNVPTYLQFNSPIEFPFKVHIGKKEYIYTVAHMWMLRSRVHDSQKRINVYVMQTLRKHISKK